MPDRSFTRPLFMDKVVDHLFVFRGNGIIEDFPGNYTDFRVYEDSKPKQENSTVKKLDTRDKSTSKVKLSYSEKKEYDTLESDIEALEIQKEAIEASFTSGDLTGDKINEQSIKLQEIKLAIEQKEERWFELSSKLES